jgi:hypothetical protein
MTLWEQEIENAGKQVVRALFRDYLSLFQGGVDRVWEAAKQANKNYLEALAAQSESDLMNKQPESEAADSQPSPKATLDISTIT